MNTRFRTLTLLACALALTLLTGCAHAAGSYVGRWVGMAQGDLFTIKSTGNETYLGTTSQGFPIYLAARDGKLTGTVLHVASAKVTIRFDHGYSHILVALPDGTRQEYKRDTRR